MAEAQRLTVRLHGCEVAELRGPRNLRLTYRDETVAKLGEGALCLSVALPVTSKPYQDRTANPRAGRTPRRSVEHWCEGLLPEGETRTVLEQRFGVARGDTFGLLAAIGNDCAGAVSFTDPDQQALTPPSAAALTPLSEERLAEAIEQLPDHPLGADDEARVSLGGLQAKLLLVRAGDHWARPGRGVMSTHILKPDPRLERPGLVASEALALKAAAAVGLEAADAELTRIKGRLVLIVSRFDRLVHGSTISRVHQEDGCQALGINPVAQGKYQTTPQGPPSYQDLARVLRDHAVDSAAELRRLAAAMVFSVALGNTDGHARNHSILIANGTVRLAPVYDVSTTTLFAATRKLGLWVDGQDTLPWVTRGHLIREMTGWGIEIGDARAITNGVLERLPAALSASAEQLAELLDPVILDAAESHVRALARSAE